MSVFIVSDLQYSVICDSIGYHLGYNPNKSIEIVSILKRENIRSVNYRYNEKTRFSHVSFKPCKIVPIEQLINFLQCVDYQSCSRPDYKQSKVYSLNMKLQNELYRILIESIKPSLFNNLEWTI